MSNKKPSFSEWLTDRNITFIIISILVVYALERFAKSVHQDLVTPAFQKCLSVTGLAPELAPELTSRLASGSENVVVKRKTWQKVLINVLELSFSVIILFILSRFIFRHDRPVNARATNNFSDKDVVVVHFVNNNTN